MNRARWGWLLMCLGLPCAFWFGLFANPAFVDPETARAPANFVHYDIYRLYFPSLHRYFEMIRGGELPAWDPYRAVGFPAMGSYLFGIFYPLNAAFLVLPVPLALTVTCILHFALAIFGMRRLLRQLRVGRGAATIAGIAFAFSGFMVFSLWHPSLFNAVATSPILAAAALRWARKGGAHRAAMFGSWVGLQALAGYLQGTVYLLYFVTPLIAWVAFRRGGVRRVIGGGALAVVIAGALSAVVVLPAQELSRLSIRPPGGLSLEATHPIGALAVTDFLAGLLDPRSGYPAADAPKDAIGRYYFRGFCYVGFAALVFALAAPLVARGRMRALALVMTAVAVASALLALGANTPFFRGFHAWVPTGDWFRFPRRFLAVMDFAVVVNAALAIDALGRGRRGALVAVWLAAAIALGAAWHFAPDGRMLAAVVALGALIGAAARTFARSPRERSIAIVLLGGLFLVDGFVKHRNRVQHPSADATPYAKLEAGRAFLRRNAGLDRVYLQRYGGQVRAHLPSKAGLLDGYHACTDYEALTLERYARYTGRISRGTEDLSLGFAGNRPLILSEHMYHNARLMDLMGVRYLGVEKGTLRARQLAALPAKDGSGTLLTPAFEGEVLAIFENAHRVPRARFVANHVVLPASEVLSRLVDPRHNVLDTVVLEAPPPPGPWLDIGDAGDASGARTKARASTPTTPVAITSYRANEVVLTVDAPRAGFVVLTDQDYPGWRAEVDGRPAPILTADSLYRAVPIAAGTHRIVFRFRPRSLYLGGAATGCGLLAVVITGVAYRRRRRRERRNG